MNCGNVVVIPLFILKYSVFIFVIKLDNNVVHYELYNVFWVLYDIKY